MVDQVKVVADEQAPAEQSLRRNLTNRHIQLIAIGGAIGTGLFMGSGKTISLAGPSIIFVYMIIGFMLFFVMRAMGELLLSNLEYKSFSDFASDLLGPWAGYFTGWTYWFCWVVTGMADVVAITARENVRRDGVLVRDDQDCRHRGADRRWSGDGYDALQITDRG